MLAKLMRSSPEKGRRAVTIATACALVVLAFMVLAPAAERVDAGARAGKAGRQPVSALQAPAKSKIRIEAVSTERGGATGRTVGTTSVLEVGASVTKYLGAGEADSPDLCSSRFFPDGTSARRFYVWQIDVRLVDVSAARTTVELRWIRSRAGQSEVSDARIITLASGSNHVFDYVSQPPGPSVTCANMMLRVLAEPMTATVDAPLTFDVWLLHEGLGGRRWVHQQLSGAVGVPSKFELDTLKWSMDGKALAGPSDQLPVGLQVSGTLLATVRPDGFVNVTVEATRILSFVEGKAGSAGEQQFATSFGEAAAIVLPQPRTRATALASAAGHPLPPSVSSGPGGLTIDFARFFAGSQASLYILVNRQK